MFFLGHCVAISGWVFVLCIWFYIWWLMTWGRRFSSFFIIIFVTIVLSADFSCEKKKTFSNYLPLTLHLVHIRPNWRITYFLYYLFDYECKHTYKLAIICSTAHKILAAIITTFENISLATAKMAILWQNFQTRSCTKLGSNQLCD